MLVLFEADMITSGSEKSQVRQCLDFCTADFLSSSANESAVQNPNIA